jgi:hypothetical protein
MDDWLFGRPVIPAGTPDLPAVGAGRVDAAGLPAPLVALLAAKVAENEEGNGVPSGGDSPDRIVCITVHDDQDAWTGDTYVSAEVEARDLDGVVWNYTFTVA